MTRVIDNPFNSILRAYIPADSDTPDADCMAALVSIGYSPDDARKRSTQPKTSMQYTPRLGNQMHGSYRRKEG